MYTLNSELYIYIHSTRWYPFSVVSGAPQVSKGMCIVYSTLYPTLYTVHCTLNNVCCTFTTTHCTLYTLQCTLHRVHCVLFYVALSDGHFGCANIPYSLQQFPLYIVQCTVYSVHFFRIVRKSLVLVERQNKSHKYHRPSITRTVPCTVYSVQCTVYSVQCTVYCVQGTEYTFFVDFFSLCFGSTDNEKVS